MPDKSKNPFRFFQELRRRKVIRVITIYCAAAFVIIEVTNNIADSLHLPDEISKWVVIALALGLIITILLSWIFDITPEGIQKTKHLEEVKTEHMPVSSNRWKIATYASIVVIIALIIFNIFSGSIRAVRLSRIEKSIAVLPFRYLSNDSSQVHFCMGMQDEILNDLSSVGALSVRSRTSTEAYKDSDITIPVIGEELNANFLVEGSVGFENNIIKVWIQLIIAEKDEHLLSNNYQIEELDDIFAVQSKIARDIAGKLEVVLTSEEINIIDKKPTDNIEAYIQMLIGDYELNKLTEDSFWKAIDHYRKAIELDPSSAKAYSHLAFAYLYLGTWFVPSPSDEYIPEVKSYVLKSLELNNNLGEAYYMLGDINYIHEWDWNAAEKNFSKGLDLNPDFAWGRIEYANFLTSMRRYDESVKLGKETIDLSPQDPNTYIELAFALWHNGENEKALQVIDKCLEIDPDNRQATWLLITYYTKLGEYNKALSYWEKMKEIFDNEIKDIPVFYIASSAQVMGFLGRREEAISLLNELNRRAVEEGYEHKVPQAWIYIGLGEKEKALDLLEQGYINRDLWMIFLNIAIEADPLRSDERFKAILEKMNFPETSN